MTNVEFFDEEIMDNVVGTLLLRPEKTVFLYTEERKEHFLSAMNKILKARKINTELFWEKIDGENLGKAKEKLEEIVSKYPDCDFDIAGGNDILLVAVGEIAKTHNLPLHMVNVKEKIVVSINKGIEYKVFDVSFKVEEIIELHGGRAGCDARESATYTWERNVKEEEDILKVWGICKADPGAWNSAIGTMKGYRNDKMNVVTMIWAKLKRDGLVYKDKNTMRYKSNLVKYLLSRQGTALEMYTYITAKTTEYFDDGQSGVVIDWKGRREVENEIDVLLTKGAVGYFISCKNGLVDSDELYKLSTVAARFGGKYAKKILVLSRFEPDRSFMERAETLGIKIVKNVRALNMKDFAKKMM